MAKKVDNDHYCPFHSPGTFLKIQDALECLQGKWKLQIIAALLTGPKRFRDLANYIAPITDRMLSKELKVLEEHLLVSRHKKSTYSIEMEYTITEHGMSLKPLIENLIDWGDLHRKEVIDKLRK